MSNIAENLMSGFRLGYGVSTDYGDRMRANKDRQDLAAAYQGADFTTAEGLRSAKQKLGQVLAGQGKVADALQVDQYIGNQMKTNLQDGLQQLHALARNGSPEAMTEAAALIPKVYGYLPNGQTVHSFYDPAGHMIHVTPIDEATGQPVQTGHGLSLNPDSLKELARGYGESIKDIEAGDLAKAAEDEAARAHKASEGLQQEQIGVSRGQLGVAREQVQATREANQSLAQYRQDDLGQRRVEHKDAMLKDFYTLAQNAAQFSEISRQKGRELDRNDQLTQSEIMRNIAGADATYMKMYGGSGEAWDVKNENAAQNLLNSMVRMDQTASPNDSAGNPVDPVALVRDSWGLMRANNPGDVSAGEAVATVKDLRANPQRYLVETADPNSPSGRLGLVRVTDRQTGRVFRAPQSAMLGMLGPGASPVQVPNRMPPSGAPPPGAVGVPDRPQSGASGGY